jgi:hypothetical protein
MYCPCERTIAENTEDVDADYVNRWSVMYTKTFLGYFVVQINLVVMVIRKFMQVKINTMQTMYTQKLKMWNNQKAKINWILTGRRMSKHKMQATG